MTYLLSSICSLVEWIFTAIYRQHVRTHCLAPFTISLFGSLILWCNLNASLLLFRKALVVQDKENQNYAIRVKMQNTGMMMRKIVNHPYLVQYPLEHGTEYARIDEDLVKTSGKLLVLDAMLTKLKERGHKVQSPNIFPQFWKFLQYVYYFSIVLFFFSPHPGLAVFYIYHVDRYFGRLSISSFLQVCQSDGSTSLEDLDGSTSLEDRQMAIKEYNNNPDLFLFLISTRAGGLGINLAAADTVILYDSDWVRIQTFPEEI